jgi:hypothetical protein
MALTLPSSFNKHSNKRNWLFQLHYDDESNFTGVAFYDTIVESIQYYGAVLNKPSIRESINLSRSTSRTSNVSLDLANFKYLADDFSAEIFAGTRDYINRIVKIYIQPEDVTDISDCLLIYTGKLNNVSHDIDSVKLSINAQKPWDGVEIPQVKTDKNNYFPIAYGDYTPNGKTVSISTSSDDDDFRNRKTLYPVPIEERRGDTIFALSGIRNTTGNAWPHYYDKAVDKFIPLSLDGADYNTVDEANEVYEDGYAVKFHQSMMRKILTKLSERVSGDSGWQSNNNAFDGALVDTSTSTSFVYDADFVNTRSRRIKFKMPQLQGFPSVLQFHYFISGTGSISLVSGSSGEIRVRLIDKTFNTNEELGYFQFLQSSGVSTTTTLKESPGNLNISSVAKLSSQVDRDTNFLADSSGWGAEFDLEVLQTQQSGDFDGQLDITFNLFDVVIETVNQLDFNNTTNGGTKADAYKFLDDLDYVYCGANGLTDNGWNSSSAITEIHEAHRDLLHRFTSYANSNTPTNWGNKRNINAAKDWRVRYWVNEPTELIKVLEKLQYEGGFIFRFNGQGAGEYIFIPDSITTDHTLNTDDLSDVKVSLSPMSQVITSMDVEYRKHPARSGYMTKVSATNSSAISDLKIGANENKKTIRLDAYVGDTSSENDIPTASTSNVNDDWYSYYDNIVGSQKLIVSATVINPLFYGIDVGDFVAFNTMPVNPFGASWSGKDFMVTKVTRQIDKLKCEFREI